MTDTRLSFKEMCARFEVTPRTLRYYEYIELLSPEKDGRSRFYGPREVARMTLILRGRRFGFSLEEIATLLGLWDDRERTSSEVKTVALAHAEDLGRKAAALEAMRCALLELAEGCSGDNRPDCPILSGLAERRPR